jgi:hypothetical protein
MAHGIKKPDKTSVTSSAAAAAAGNCGAMRQPMYR